MRDKVFYLICFGFILGVLLRSFIFIDQYLVGVSILISFLLLLFLFFVSPKKILILFCIFIFSFSCGILRFHASDISAPEVFGTRLEKNSELSGVVVDDPDMRETNQKLVILVKLEEGKSKILLTVDLEDKFRYGDEVSFSGVLEKPKNFITDQGRKFDYENYLRKDGIFYVMNYPKIEVVSHGNGNRIKGALFFVKEEFLKKINFIIPEPESLLMGGLILGEKSPFSKDLRQSFVDTGTIHIIALSGYNVTIVAEWIMKIFSFLPRNFGFGAGILGILLFVVMAGGSSTAVRAGTMATLALIARATGRNYDVARALVLAGAVMILVNPFVLVFDVSFQLSFMATVAVIFFAPRVEKYFLWITPRFGLRDVVAVTVSAYIFVMPFILYKMGNLSLVALPANILILPFIPLTMMLGFFTGFAGFIWYIFGIPFGYLSYLLLHYELAIVGFFSRLPFASFSIPNFPLFVVFLFYGYFTYRIFGKEIKAFFGSL
ncbi:ComEC family competence protein [Patescibacteria group bacterium]|nr:ComEC family competence protein [Patescibacteria group bacterium]